METDPDHERRDVRLAGRALREKWDLPPDSKGKIIAKLVEIALTGKNRSAANAAKILLQAEQVEIGWKKVELAEKQGDDAHSILALVATIETRRNEQLEHDA